MSYSFDLHVLGWKAYEDLVACIFRDILGQTLQVFSDGVDGGRDAAFHGTWKLSAESEAFSGSFCIQCKHTSKVHKSLSNNIINDELIKVKRLAGRGLCDNYFLVTNHVLPAGFAEEAEKQFIAAGASAARIFGYEWLVQVIAENPRLRRLVPRLYGLGDLTQIITHNAYRQAREVLDSIAPDLACFVPTKAYRQCAHALRDLGFVLLLGEPASGKTMIANLMALSAADEWDLQTLMICSPSDFSKCWNPDDPGQFLWVDDAFGATQYDANRVNEWNQLLPKLKAAIKLGARVVFTSRDYIFSAAKRDLKISAFELFDDSRVVIQVEELTRSERQMILYSHLKAGSQPLAFKTAVKPYLEDAAQVPKFLPEIARRFGNPKFTSQMSETHDGVEDFFKKPIKVLFDIVSTLAPAEKAAIGLIFTSGGKLAIPVAAGQQVFNILDQMDVTIGEAKAALVSLDDSLLKKVKEGGEEYWAFRHPTIRDAFATLVGSNPELIDVYLAGVSTEQLLLEVSCNALVEGAKIIVPNNRHDIILQKLREYKSPKNMWSDPIKTFLSRRCTPALIASYYETENLSTCIPYSIWNVGSHDDGINILSKLSHANLLSENIRQAAVKKIIDLSEEAHSCRFAESSHVRDLFSLNEEELTIERITKGLLANSDTILDDLKNNWDPEQDDPSELFSEIDRSLEFIEGDERFYVDTQSKASSLRMEIKQLVNMLEDDIQDPEYEELDTEQAVETTSIIKLSVFDDVDQ